MAAAALIAVAPRQGHAAVAKRPPPTLNFLAATSKLTGVTLDRSYMQMADTVWSLLTLDGGGERLRLLVWLVNRTREDRLETELRRLGLRKTAERVMTAWYTGNVEVSRSHLSDPLIRRLLAGNAPGAGKTVTVVFNYDEALTWQACSYTKASATCGGPFGYWHDAPAA
jgi:hypothetical protein